MPHEPCRTYLPPEWAPQSGVMLTWPHDKSDWAPILGEVEPVFAEIARQVARFEKRSWSPVMTTATGPMSPNG